MIQPPFPSTIGAQPRPVTFLTTKTAVRKYQERNGQTGSHASALAQREGGGKHGVAVFGQARVATR